ncbi:MAG TPA: hypothetical protein VF071_07215 [Candidatus Limnocylindria bacterium]
MLMRFIPVLVALVAVPIGWLVTHLVVLAFGYPGDPARGPAITGAAIHAVGGFAVASWLIARRQPRP